MMRLAAYGDIQPRKDPPRPEDFGGSMRLSDQRTQPGPGKKLGRGLLGKLGAGLEPLVAAIAGLALHSNSQLLSHKAACRIKTGGGKSSAVESDLKAGAGFGTIGA